MYFFPCTIVLTTPYHNPNTQGKHDCHLVWCFCHCIYSHCSKTCRKSAAVWRSFTAPLALPAFKEFRFPSNIDSFKKFLIKYFCRLASVYLEELTHCQTRPCLVQLLSRKCALLSEAQFSSGPTQLAENWNSPQCTT